MDRRQFEIFRAVICVAIGAVVVYAVSIGNILLPVIVVVSGFILLSLGKKRVTEVIEDERIYRISERASKSTLQSFGVGIALTGLSLLLLDKHTEAGYALTFSACALGLLYLIFYKHYSRRGLE